MKIRVVGYELAMHRYGGSFIRYYKPRFLGEGCLEAIHWRSLRQRIGSLQTQRNVQLSAFLGVWSFGTHLSFKLPCDFNSMYNTRLALEVQDTGIHIFNTASSCFMAVNQFLNSFRDFSLHIFDARIRASTTDAVSY